MSLLRPRKGDPTTPVALADQEPFDALTGPPVDLTPPALHRPDVPSLVSRPDNLISAAQAEAVRFASGPDGNYDHAQVDAFVDDVVASLGYLEAVVVEKVDELATLMADRANLMATLDVFRANGRVATGPNGELLTEADSAQLAEMGNLASRLAAVQAELEQARAAAAAAVEQARAEWERGHAEDLDAACNEAVAAALAKERSTLARRLAEARAAGASAQIAPELLELLDAAGAGTNGSAWPTPPAPRPDPLPALPTAAADAAGRGGRGVPAGDLDEETLEVLRTVVNRLDALSSTAVDALGQARAGLEQSAASLADARSAVAHVESASKAVAAAGVKVDSAAEGLTDNARRLADASETAANALLEQADYTRTTTGELVTARTELTTNIDRAADDLHLAHETLQGSAATVEEARAAIEVTGERMVHACEDIAASSEAAVAGAQEAQEVISTVSDALMVAAVTTDERDAAFAEATSTLSNAGEKLLHVVDETLTTLHEQGAVMRAASEETGAVTRKAREELEHARQAEAQAAAALSRAEDAAATARGQLRDALSDVQGALDEAVDEARTASETAQALHGQTVAVAAELAEASVGRARAHALLGGHLDAAAAPAGDPVTLPAPGTRDHVISVLATAAVAAQRADQAVEPLVAVPAAGRGGNRRLPAAAGSTRRQPARNGATKTSSNGSRPQAKKATAARRASKS